MNEEIVTKATEEIEANLAELRMQTLSQNVLRTINVIDILFSLKEEDRIEVLKQLKEKYNV